MKKITVHVTSRLKCSYSSGGVRSISHVRWWDLVLFALSVPQKGSLSTHWDPCAALITLEHWDEKEQVLIFRSRRIAVLILKVFSFLCGSQISLLCYPQGANHGVELCFGPSLVWVQ